MKRAVKPLQAIRVIKRIQPSQNFCKHIEDKAIMKPGKDQAYLKPKSGCFMCHMKKRCPVTTEHLFSKNQNRQSVTTGAAGTAAAAARCPKIHIGIQGEPHACEINLYAFSLLHKLFVHNKFMSFHIKGIIRVFRLIQSHGKGRSPSAAGIEKNPDRGGFLPLKIVINLRFGRICQFNHL